MKLAAIVKFVSGEHGPCFLLPLPLLLPLFSSSGSSANLFLAGAFLF